MIHSLSSNLLETGAVFTLGKSYLYDDTANEAQTSDSSPPKPSSPTEAERTIAEPERKKPTPKRQQSYFFVKNDPIVKIVCGNKQSGVVCGEYCSHLVRRLFKVQRVGCFRDT